MFNNVALDVVIGLVFVYLLYSLLGTLVQEIIATKIGLRAIVLKQAIGRMLDDDGLTVDKKMRALAKKIKEIEKIKGILRESEADDKNRELLLKQIEELKEQQKKISNEQPAINDEEKTAEFTTQLVELKKEENEKTKALSELSPSKTISLKKEYDELENNHFIGISQIADDLTKTKLSQAFYDHPLIKYLAADNSFLKNIPSYIDPETFSKVVVDLLRGQNIAVGSSDRQPIQTSLTSGRIEWDKKVKIEPETLSYLRSIWADSQGDVIKFKANLEQWFNEMMDRATGWYKKYTQIILLGVGLVIAGSFNVDTIKIVRILENNPAIRDQVLAQANAYSKEHKDLDGQIAQQEAKVNSFGKPTAKDNAAKLAAEKKSLDQKKASKALEDTLFSQANHLVGKDINQVNSVLSLGWNGGFCKNFEITSLLGWVLTALAISMGAPFWFDLLNKLVQLRSSVAPKDDAKAKTDTGANTTPSPTKRVG